MPSKSAPTLRPVFGLAALLVAIEIAAHFLPEGQMTRSLHFRLQEIATLPPADVQIMGESVVARLPAAVVEASLRPHGVTVANYALHGTSPLFAEYVLQRQIAAGRAPRAILYAPHPALLSAPMLDRFVGRFARGDESLDVLRHGAPPSAWLFGALCKTSYTLRYREELRTCLVDGNPDFFRSWNWPVSSVNDSRIPRPLPEPAPPHRFLPADVSPQLERPLSIDPLVAASLDRFCTLAASRQIHIYWVSLPMLVLLDPHGTPGEHIYANYLEELTRRHANVTLLHPQIDILPDSSFIDPWHLNDRAAWLFAQTIGTELATQWAGSAEPPKAGK